MDRLLTDKELALPLCPETEPGERKLANPYPFIF